MTVTSAVVGMTVMMRLPFVFVRNLQYMQQRASDTVKVSPLNPKHTTAKGIVRRKSSSDLLAVQLSVTSN